MSLSVSINSCQKLCVTIPSSCLSSEPYTWTSSDVTVATVNANNTNAIIKATYGNGGLAVISIQDSLLNTVFVVYVTVTNYLNTTVINPAYQYNLSCQLTKSPPVSGTKATFAGPLNYFNNPATVGLCLLGMAVGQGLNCNVNGGIFIPNSTNSTIELYGLFSVVAAVVPVNFALFQPVVGGLNVNPLVPYASSFTTLPSNPGQPVQIFNTGVLPCDVADYLSFVMLNESTNNRKITASKFSGGFIQFQFNLINPTVAFTASAIVAPLNYFNAASTSIIYSALVQVTVPVSVATQSVNFVIPSISPDAVWFAQQNDIDNTKATSIDVLRAGNNGATTLTIDYNRILAGASTFIAHIAVIAYKNQTVPGLTLTIT